MRRRAYNCALAAAAALLSACASASLQSPSALTATDIWDTSLLTVRHIDPGMLAFASDSADVSGFVSAVAAQGDRLYVVDAGTSRLLEIGLAGQTLRTIGVLRDGSSPGLIAADDGRIYALDPADRSILVVDPFLGGQQRISLAGAAAAPADIALIDGRDLVVFDRLDSRIVFVDGHGVAYRSQQLNRPGRPTMTSGRAMAYAGGLILVLDEQADDIVGFNSLGAPVGMFASNEVQNATAMATDDCGRYFVAGQAGGTIFLGLPDVSVPGVRVPVADLDEKDVTDMWIDGVFLYVATRSSGIFVYLVDPACD